LAGSALRRGIVVLIVLEGIDGSGKTTLAPLVCARLSPPGGPAEPLLKKFVDYPDAYTHRHLKRLRHVIWGERKPSDDMMGGEHWALMIAAWYAVLSRRRLEGAAQVFVSDGWFFRNIMKSIEDAGLDEAWLTGLFEPVAPPDLVVLLDVLPEVVLARRRKFDHRECGGWATGGPVDFVTYQTRIRRRLLTMAENCDWAIVQPAPSESPDALADRVADLISDRFGWSSEAAA
jgi:thymidylate kinase